MKKTTLRQAYEEIEKTILKTIKKNSNLANVVKIPKKPKRIRRKHIEKIEEVKIDLMRYAKKYSREERSRKSKEYWKRLKEENPEKYQERRKRLSQQSKEYWRRLKEQNPEEFNRRIKKLQDARKNKGVVKKSTPVPSSNRSDAMKEYWRKLKEENPEEYEKRISKLRKPVIGETTVDLEKEAETEDSIDADEYDYIYDDFVKFGEENQKEIDKKDKDVYETIDSFMKKQEDFKDSIGKDSYAKIILFNFIRNAIDNYDEFDGSPYAIEFVSMLVDNFGTERAAFLIQKASEELGIFTVEILYDVESTMNFADDVMEFLWNNNYLDDDIDEDAIHNFTSSIKEMVDKMVNSDERFSMYD